MLLHYSELSSVRVLVEQGKEIIVKESGVNPQALNSLQREFSVIRDMESRGLDYGLLTKHDNILTDSNNTLRFTRKGTHDLSDVGHDLKIAEFAEIITNLVCEIDSIHKTGYVHRDIKPGNVMVTQNSKGAKTYAGIVDFGMALKINRRQDEEGVAGGTKPFCHRVQFEPLERAHPGLDWYSLALTSLYLMRSDVTSIEAELAANPDGIIVDLNGIFGNNNGTISTFNPFSTGSNWLADFCMLLPKLIQFATSSNCTLDGLSEIAAQLVKISREFLRRKDWRRIPNGGQNLPLYGSNLVRHDILLIVDETNSLASQMDKIKQTLDDVVAEFDGAMDLRVDLWAVRDYSRADTGAIAEDTVRKVAYRLTPRAMAFAIDEIAADAPQHDEAEAYEMAFEEALGYGSSRPSLWHPRGNTTRTVILAGDAYAHGWLRKPWWFVWLGMVKKGQESEIERKERFTKNHPNALTHSNIERENIAREQKLQKAQDSVDQFGAQHEFVPNSKGGTQNRPNAMNVVRRLRDKKKCTIHTIFLGTDIVAKSYMKFVACLGDGVFIEAGSDFGDALVGVFASPDKQLYDKLVNQGNTSESAKKNLAPLTTFVLDV